jgi:exodeoxyribonuclease VII large subunit
MQHDILASLNQSLVHKNPINGVSEFKNILFEKHQRTSRALDVFQKATRQKLHRLISELDALSPLSVLNRGYSVTLDEQQKAVKSVHQIKPRETLQLKLNDGKVVSRVEQIFVKTPFNESQ